MYKEQIDQIANNDNFDAFMEHFGFEYPTMSVEFDWLNSEWWGFSLDSRIPLHRKHVVKAAYEVFQEARSGLGSEYRTWADKYPALYYYWQEQRQAETTIANTTPLLTKPLKAYAYDWRNKCYKHKTAQALYEAQNRLKYANERISSLLAVSDTLPTVHDDILRTWVNFELTLTITEKLVVATPPKKATVQKPLTFTIDVSNNQVDPQILAKMLRTVTSADCVAFLGLGTVNVRTLRDWLANFDEPITFTDTEDGFALIWSKPHTILKNVANFKTIKVGNALVHNIIAN